MKLYVIKYLSQTFFSEASDPFAGVSETIFSTPQEARNFIQNTCIPEAEEDNKDCYEDGESELTFEVQNGPDYSILETYQDGELIETVEFEICEVTYNKEA